MVDKSEQKLGNSVRVCWELSPDPEILAAITEAGFELVEEGAEVIVSEFHSDIQPSGLFGPRRIVLISATASAEDPLEAGAFRVLRTPVQPASMVVQIQRAATDWHRTRRMVLHSSLIDRIHDLAFATDGEGRVSFINNSAIRTLGIQVSDAIGLPIDSLIPGAWSSDDDVVNQYSIEVEGEQMRIQGIWQMLSDPDGRPLSRALVARDISREYFLRRDLVRSGALAELGMMAAEVAHEVKNPATYLMTNLSILRDDIQGGTMDLTQAAELVEECLDGVTRITDIVRRMRSLASGDSEEGMDALMDLSWVARDACRIAGLRVKYKAELHIHDAVVPQVRGSSKRIGQVILNLVVNAADALTGQIDPMPRIDVTLGQDEAHAWVDVRDNGPGVPERMREKMFEAFVTSKSDEGGTGLGLAVSSTIADEHGGRLELRRHDGPGAWFRLWLPLTSS